MLTDKQYNIMLESLAQLIEATAGKAKKGPVEGAAEILDDASADVEDRYATILDTLSLLVESKAASTADAARIVRSAKADV